MIAALLASIVVATNAVTFTASATGIGKGDPTEFLWITSASEHGYEALFVLDDPAEELLAAFRRAGFKNGMPQDARTGNLYHVGDYVTISPSLLDFVQVKKETIPALPPLVYTGGRKDEKGVSEVLLYAPNALLAFFDCPQAPFLFDGLFRQGEVYGAFTSKLALKKGEKRSFTVSLTGQHMRHLDCEIRPGNIKEVICGLRSAATNSTLDVLVSFAPELTVLEATLAAQALALVDSTAVKINGTAAGNLYFRAFLPLVKWLDRKERLLQPFELTLGENETDDKLVVVDEDWSGSGADPTLHPHEIPFAEAGKYPQIKTCFIYATKTTPLKRVFGAMKRLNRPIINYYVFADK